MIRISVKKIFCNNQTNHTVDHDHRRFKFLDHLNDVPHDGHRIVAAVAVDAHQVAALTNSDDGGVGAIASRVHADDDRG